MKITGNGGDEDGTGAEGVAEAAREPKKRVRRAKPNIQVIAANESVSGALSSSGSRDELPPEGSATVPDPSSNGGLVPILIAGEFVAPIAAMDRMLAAANDLESLGLLNAQFSGVEKMLREMHVREEELNRMAAQHLQLARKTGQALLASDHRGGRGSKSHAETSIRGGSSKLLPAWVTKQRSWRYRRIARIDADVFNRYLDESLKGLVPITEAGLLRANRLKGLVKSRAAPSDKGSLDSVWDAICKAVDVDLAVGVEKGVLESTERLDTSAASQAKLAGCVVVRTNEDLHGWLRRLHQGRQTGAISHAILVTSVTGREPWLRTLDAQEWTCCFVAGGTQKGPATIVAHIGEKWRAVALNLGKIGAVFRGAEAQEID